MTIEQLLLDHHAVQLRPEQPFTWASGMRAPIYCDHRLLLGHVAARNQVAEALAVLAAAAQPEVIAGTATAGIPWGMLVADRLSLPFVYVRSEAKAHGTGRYTEGAPCADRAIVLIEDLISTGGSSLRCVDRLRAEGASQVTVAAIFTYELTSSRTAFTNHGTSLSTVTSFSQLLRAAGSSFSPEATASLQAWQHNPEAWSAQH